MKAFSDGSGRPLEFGGQYVSSQRACSLKSVKQSGPHFVPYNSTLMAGSGFSSWLEYFGLDPLWMR